MEADRIRADKDDTDEQRKMMEKYNISSLTIPEYIFNTLGADFDIYQDDEQEDDLETAG